MKRTKVKKKNKKKTLEEQVKSSSAKKPKNKPKYDGDISKVVSTGSTLLDLALTGERIHGGGIPSGILVEIFGPPGSGKTVIMCETAGNIQRGGGQVMFMDPEARLDRQFSNLLGFKPDMDGTKYGTPDTVPEVFAPVRDWEPEPEDVLHGIFTDSLAALSTDLEMDNEEGDKRGQRRAKEFSQETRRTCRTLKRKGFVMMCSNQVRENPDAGPYTPKDVSTGGKALPHYASVRLKCHTPSKIKKEKKVKGKTQKRVVGTKTLVEVIKSSVGKPYRTAEVPIIFEYGIDDVRANLQFVKDHSSDSVYTINGRKLEKSLDQSCSIIEDEGLEKELREEVIALWWEIESSFLTGRKKKR